MENWKDAGVIDTSNSPNAKLKTIPVNAVKLGGFWKPRLDANRNASIMKLFKLLEENGVTDNFLIASGKKQAERRGPLFTDSDLYKWIEAASFVLQTSPSREISDAIGKAVEAIAGAQEPSGYLNSYFTGPHLAERLKGGGLNHEYYCSGHLIQAAIAHYRATGKRDLFDVAVKLADFWVENVGPDKEIKMYRDHPELEMAMVELYRTTRKKEYLEYAKKLLDNYEFPGYREMEPRRPTSSGHSVMACYLCCGAADYVAETGDEQVRAALDSLWQDVTMRKMFITGGVGSRHVWESFGQAYELPNLRAYAETCAAIANLMWNWRMLCVTGEARFADVAERVLYNGFLSGVSLDGVKYFYTNPLASLDKNIDLPHVSEERLEWHGCTCCPPNVQRMFASLPGYFYTTSREGIWVHFYGESAAGFRLSDGAQVRLAQNTAFPWDGRIEISVSLQQEKKFSLFLRIPGWCRKASVSINNKKISKPARPSSYLNLNRTWKKGDRVTLDLEMPAVLIEAHPRLDSARGAVAIQRGPVVYCVESTDNPGIPVPDIELGSAKLSCGFEKDLLGGIILVKGRVSYPADWKKIKPLYLPKGEKKQAPGKKRKLNSYRITPGRTAANRRCRCGYRSIKSNVHRSSCIVHRQKLFSLFGQLCPPRWTSGRDLAHFLKWADRFHQLYHRNHQSAIITVIIQKEEIDDKEGKDVYRADNIVFVAVDTDLHPVGWEMEHETGNDRRNGIYVRSHGGCDNPAKGCLQGADERSSGYFVQVQLLVPGCLVHHAGDRHSRYGHRAAFPRDKVYPRNGGDG